jgi:hypothetical protein
MCRIGGVVVGDGLAGVALAVAIPSSSAFVPTCVTPLLRINKVRSVQRSWVGKMLGGLAAEAGGRGAARNTTRNRRRGSPRTVSTMKSRVIDVVRETAAGSLPGL